MPRPANHPRFPRLLTLVATGFGASLLLAGCAGSDTPQAATTSTASANSTEAAPSTPPTDAAAATPDAPVETATDAPLTLPTCEQMNPMLVTMHEDFASSANDITPMSEINLDYFNQYAGPTAQTAMESATQVRGCLFNIYFDGQQPRNWNAELSPEAQQPLISALRADPGITEVAHDEAIAFTYDIEEGLDDPNVHPKITMVTYIFIGSAWIIDFDGVENGDLRRTS